MSESCDFRWSGAVNIRWTMSWSVPCVAMVSNVEPMNAAKSVYGSSNIAFNAAPNGNCASQPRLKEFHVDPNRRDLSCTVSSPPGIFCSSKTIAKITELNMRTAWIRSVQTTALIPPTAV